MADWRKTKCCGTCIYFPVADVLDAAGRLRKERAAQCGWRSVELYPDAMGSHFHRPEPGWTTPLRGEFCPCYTAQPLPERNS